MPVSTECAAALLSFRYPSILCKFDVKQVLPTDLHVFLGNVLTKLCWLAHNLLLLLLAGKHRIPFHSGWDCVIFVFLTLLAGKKPSNMIAGWDFYFLKVLLASSEERVFFSQES